MEQKKAGIPLVALIIFFALIIGIILTCLIILSTRKSSDKGGQIKLSSDTNTTNEENAVVNNIEEPPAPVEEKGTEISLTEANVINAYKLAGNRETSAKFAIYQNGDFNLSSANEVLKLKMAFAQLTPEELASGTIPKAKIEEKLVKVFGTSEGVNMQTVVLFSDYNYKTNYNIVSFDYNEQAQSFSVNKQSIENTDPSLVTEVVNKAISYPSKLEIYVTPMFIQTTDYTNEGASTKAYSLYSGYDFANQTFNDLLIAVKKEDYYNALISGDTLDIDKFNYENLSSNIQKNRQDNLDIKTLQQYKYTFTKNNEDYVLSSFEKVAQDSQNQ
ncbi:MAG: hypothetical protein HFJ43_04170 [Clostridia bacterium]|nr:hypothetical protein [Clostridia bacterium]